MASMPRVLKYIFKKIFVAFVFLLHYINIDGSHWVEADFK